MNGNQLDEHEPVHGNRLRNILWPQIFIRTENEEKTALLAYTKHYFYCYSHIRWWGSSGCGGTGAFPLIITSVCESQRAWRYWTLSELFCTSPLSRRSTEANYTPLEERWLKLAMHYYLKTRAGDDNPAHHALHEFDWTTSDLYPRGPNRRRGMTRPPTPAVGHKVEADMASTELVYPLRHLKGWYVYYPLLSYLCLIGL